jgi:hypothetical protein
VVAPMAVGSIAMRISSRFHIYVPKKQLSCS